MNTVFRHETKFVCRLDEIDHVYSWLHGNHRGINEEYPDRYINNIYFDWFDLQDASDNLIGLGRREKMRLRWYGDVEAESPMRLERKIKRDRLGTKRIIDLNSFSLRATSRSDLTERIVAHGSETQPLALDLRLRNPVVRNRYLRQYYVTAAGRVRLTIDSQQTFYSVDHDDEVLRGNTITYPLYVVELKYDEADLGLVRSIMNGFPLRPVRHSKYLAGLARVIEQPYF
ncbi:MAG: polyphosphate polymerase domain-containing protein [Halioglobus sp.]|nr:polyphosphate polymerase domain-containing protein [Halioglobus sp.]